jgi:hypothetical protein
LWNWCSCRRRFRVRSGLRGTGGIWRGRRHAE